MSTTKKPASPPDFIAAQYAFAGHIRDPKRQPPPADVDERRMAVYRELFFDNIENFLSGNFPVLRAITEDAPWLALCRDFMIRHRSRSPYFTDIGAEFIDYLQNEREPHADDPPFLLELARYERIELELSIAEDPTLPAGLDPNGDLLSAPPFINPLLASLCYRYPVHQIGPEWIPDREPEQPSFLFVWRDRDETVRFLEANAASARLLELLKEYPTESGLSVLQHLSVELQHPDPERIIAFGSGVLNDLRQRHILLGTLLA